MHAPSKPPVELASLLFAKESPVVMAISPCRGNRQSNWRVPTGTCSRLSRARCRFSRRPCRRVQVQCQAMQEGIAIPIGGLLWVKESPA